MKDLKNMSCEEELRQLGLFSHEERRLREPHCSLQLPEKKVRWGPVSSIVPAVRGPEEIVLS